MIITRSQAEKKLKLFFGLDRFYDEQWKTIERLLKGERMLLIEPDLENHYAISSQPYCLTE